LVLGFRDASGVVPPPRFDGEVLPLPGPAPAVGAHTREILAELGLDPEPLFAAGTVT
jgi:crotonobetainyl-CoA:carnitine CoA-transferase CaiB-like acyl-CoA transferase